MNLSIGQRILCRLAGGSELIEAHVAAIIAPSLQGGRIVPACVRLDSGRYVRRSWIVAAYTA